MLTNIFESRNKTFLNLVKLGDYLGRSLRENVELFSVDGDSVTYLTESGNVIRGNYSKDTLTLSNIEVQDSSLLENEEVFNQVTDKKIGDFLADLIESDIPSAKNSFDSILNLWETKLNFNKTQKRLNEKVGRFDESLNILNTEEFDRLLELKDDLVKILKENEEFIRIPDVRNMIRLSSVISNAFNIPYISIEELDESGSFTVPQALNTNLYEHLCKQELVAQELLESKEQFDGIWLTNAKIQQLPSFIYESDDNIQQLIAEIINELPYFAMATKKQLITLVEGNLDLLVEDKQVPEKDIKNFVTKIFEFKKPVKNYLTEVLNEKYGVNVHNLTTVPTFNSLVGMESLLFEALAKLTPKSSNLRRVLNEFSQLLSEKTGVESIDVSDFLTGVFYESGYSNMLNETNLLNYLDFSRIADDLGKVGQVLKMIQMGSMGGDPMMGQQGLGQQMGQPMGSPEGQMQDGGPLTTGMTPDDIETEPQGELDQDTDENPMAQMDPNQAAAEAGMEDEMVPGQEGEMGEEGGGSGDPIVDTLEQIKDLITNLEVEMGMGGEEGEIPSEEGMEGEMPPEEGGDDITVDGGEGDDEIHVDSDSHGSDGGSEESDDSEEEKAPPKKEKKKKE